MLDLELRGEADGLIGWQGIDGKETGRVAGEAVERDHANPLVEGAPPRVALTFTAFLRDCEAGPALRRNVS